MNNSILQSVKKNLGLPEDYDVFDADIIIYINTALSTLTQVGVGPDIGFQIDDDTAEWGDLLGGDPRLNSVQSYITLKTRLLFDPPATSFAIAAIEKQVEEMLWRLNLTADPAPIPADKSRGTVIAVTELWAD